MKFDGKLLARAREQLERQQAANQAEQNRRQAEIARCLPQVEQLEQRMRQQMTELVHLTISRAPDMKERIGALEKENLELQARKAELLQEKGYPMDYLEPIYSCPKCRDSGVFEGGVCSCLETLYNQALTQELGTLLQQGNERFEQFRLDYYSPERAAGICPRDQMGKVLESCKRFAAKFPQVSANLLLQGGTGLGKTFLSACMAREIAARGHSVCYESASAALDTFERAKFSRNAEEAEAAALRVQRMLSCDLMILDDLGTEMVTPMSVSALYTLINTRLVNHRKTIISTNCSDEELQKKYSPQICSRIEGEFLCLPFVGQDIRKIKKGV